MPVDAPRTASSSLLCKCGGEVSPNMAQALLHYGDSRRVGCPACGARPGCLCSTGTDWRYHGPHAMRVERAMFVELRKRGFPFAVTKGDADA